MPHSISDRAASLLSRSELVDRWQRAFKRPAPPRLSRVLLEQSLAYNQQATREGALSNRARGSLRAAARSKGVVRTGQPAPGAKIIREWHGVLHVVEVQDDGFEYRGRVYRSLSAIAIEITGTVWSGPRFFGLRNLRP